MDQEQYALDGHDSDLYANFRYLFLGGLDFANFFFVVYYRLDIRRDY